MGGRSCFLDRVTGCLAAAFHTMKSHMYSIFFCPDGCREGERLRAPGLQRARGRKTKSKEKKQLSRHNPSWWSSTTIVLRLPSPSQRITKMAKGINRDKKSDQLFCLRQDQSCCTDMEIKGDQKINITQCLISETFVTRSLTNQASAG